MSTADQGYGPATGRGLEPARRPDRRAGPRLPGRGRRAGPWRGRRRDRPAAAAGGLPDPAGRCPARREQGRHPAGQLGARRGRRPGPGRAARRPGPAAGRLRRVRRAVRPLLATPSSTAFRLSDDLAAVAADLIHGLQHYQAGRSLEALWWWQYSYVNHWGTHGAAALRALHAVLAHAMLDVAEETSRSEPGGKTQAQDR